MDNNSKKKIKKNLTIIGGGITGCAIALLAKAKFYNNIKILEISKRLGGVLKDLQFGNEIFLNGCQYIDINSDWFKRIKKKNHFLNNLNILIVNMEALQILKIKRFILEIIQSRYLKKNLNLQ